MSNFYDDVKHLPKYYRDFYKKNKDNPVELRRECRLLLETIKDAGLAETFINLVELLEYYDSLKK